MMWLVAAVAMGQIHSATPAVELVTLRNGMQWLLHSRPDDGHVSGVVTVRAGGVDERAGQTGVAHLLEHLAFAGTPITGARSWSLERPRQEQLSTLLDTRARLIREGKQSSLEVTELTTEIVAAERYWAIQGDPTAYTRLMFHYGVRQNAWTSKDTTTYWGDFPKAQLHLWLGAEAQRFAAPVFRNFSTEQDVVIQEWVDRRTPLSQSLDAMWALAFEGSGYAWSIAGREADVRVVSPADIATFYEQHYAPSRAVGCLVGDFDVAQARAWLEETFAQIPDRPTQSPAQVTLTSPRITTHRATEAWSLVAFEWPSVFAAKQAAFQLVAAMFEMEDGPLHGLEAKGPIAAATTRQGPGLSQTHLLVVSARVRSGHTPAEARAAVLAALTKWKPDEAALVRAKAWLELDRLTGLDSRKSAASTLAQHQLMGDWRDAYASPWHDLPLSAVQTVIDGLVVDKAWVIDVEAAP